MAETISSAPSSMEIVLKDNGVIVDMTPANRSQHNPILMHSHSLRSLKDNNNVIKEEQLSSKTACATRNSISPTNLSTTPPSTTFRCERCDNFETNSRASLLLHVVHCLSSPAHLKTEETDPENLSLNSVSHMDSNSSSGMQLNTSETQPSAVVSPSNVATSASAVSVINGSVASPSPLSTSSTNASRKVFECDVCNMKFSNGANMRRHKMRHTGVKPYECRVCQKRFFRKDHLAEHFTTHTKTLPYHCPICNRGFQRQIAMRAHFQNEHVGQHDLVKTCPLCSYRAGSMKSLRIHFFNRHGIDLDNPGPGGTSSLLLALESQATQVAAAAAAAGFVPGLNAVSAAAAAVVNAANATVNGSVNNPSQQSESGESMRSVENATPPMHFLTPHVEISTMSDNGSELFNGNSAPGSVGSESFESKGRDRDCNRDSRSSISPANDLSMDCSSKSVPSSTSSMGIQLNVSSSKSIHHDNHITPSISLIPIKQEPISEESNNEPNKSGSKFGILGDRGDSNENDFSSSNSGVTSLIKVSPLKSLLREDLKRRICAKANYRITRNAAALDNNNIVMQESSSQNNSPCNAIPICNGTITSSGQESDGTALNRKQILTCLFCGIEFPDETLYFLHKGCHCESNPWKCNICGEQCNNVYEFNSHLLSKSHQ